MRENGFQNRTGVEVTHFSEAERNCPNVCGVDNERDKVKSQKYRPIWYFSLLKKLIIV